MKQTPESALVPHLSRHNKWRKMVTKYIPVDVVIIASVYVCSEGDVLRLPSLANHLSLFLLTFGV